MEKWNWTDALVTEFATWYRTIQCNPPLELWGKSLMEEFKKSKEQPIEPKSVIAGKLSRTTHFGGYYFSTSKDLTDKQSELINDAIQIILNQPITEDKKEEPKPDWEIVACKGGLGVIHEYNPDICLGADTNVIPCHVHSIKRLSDGELFSVGDTTHAGNIELFYIDNNNQCFVKHHNGFTYSIGSLNKFAPAKIPLFTTEDGYDIREENLEVFSVLTKGSWDTGTTTYKKRGGYKNGTAFTEASPWKHFYYEKARDKYIQENKPFLSVTDVINLLETRSEEVEDGGIVGINWIKNNLTKLALSKTKKEI